MREYRKKWAILLSIGMGVFLATIDGSIVNIGLNTLVKDLHQPLAVVEWVVLAYMLTICTLMLSIGRLGDMIGKKKLYLAGLIIFTLGSMLCGLAPTVYWLIGFRVLQAIGASMLMALGTALVTEAFPAKERGKALGILGTLVSIGIITGPTLGGLILESLTWHWLFFVNLPVGLIGVVLVALIVPDNQPPVVQQKFDFFGAGILFIGLVGLLSALTIGQHSGFFNPTVILLFILFAVALAAFIRVESRTASPMIDLKMFKNRMFSINLVTGFLAFIVSAGTILIIPFYLQNILLYSPRETGLMMAITPLTVALVSPISGSLSDRIGSRLITTLGLVMILLGHVFLTTLSAETTTLGYLLRFIPVGIGIGLFQSPNNSAIMGSAPRERLGVASSLLSLTRTIGQTTGIALLGAFWETRVKLLSGSLFTKDITSAPVAAQVAGLQDTIRLDVAIISVALVLSIWALIQWNQSRKGLNPSTQP
jgi:EmrB/QacA subfamily drug resistance transporter